SVNLFHGRVEEGQLHLGDHALALDKTAADADGKAVAFVRPHEFDLLPGAQAGGLPAKIVRIVAVGASARIELSEIDRSDGEVIEVTVARDLFRLLALAAGDVVSLRPRQIRVFQTPALAA
ncbi:MAG TPA: TOBE-like domain-containing protein, partial [Accumulibacter sp.]|nr:TOBE-like domain-containing protein [Accumulibacter sp.]